jgi:putative ABC transport system substrate-binding protein
MLRREFITFLCGAAAVRPFAARAQLAPAEQAVPPVIGFLNDLSPDQWSPAITALRRTLSEAGHVEGRNLAFTYRWTEGKRERLPTLAADLVRAKVAVIVASGHTAAVMAARAATSDIPIVFITGDDPVKFGLVSSLERPGVNATGIYLVRPTDDNTIRQSLLRQLVPDAKVFFNLNVTDSTSAVWDRDPEEAIAGLFGTTQSFNINTHVTVPTPRSLMIASGPFLDGKRRDHLVSLVARKGVPALYDWRDFAEAGGLISYGASLADLYARMGNYVARILGGESPADLPVVKPTKFETVVNLRTAARLGIKIPPALLDRADEMAL